MSLPFGTNTLAQIAFVVDDIESSRKQYAALLGVAPPSVIETASGKDTNEVYLGVPSDARAKLAFFQLGPVQLELIEPIGEDSSWAAGLRQGGGFHHLAFWVESMTGPREHLAEQGYAQEHRGDMGSGQFVYFRHDKLPRIELLQKEGRD